MLKVRDEYHEDNRYEDSHLVVRSSSEADHQPPNYLSLE